MMPPIRIWIFFFILPAFLLSCSKKPFSIAFSHREERIEKTAREKLETKTRITNESGKTIFRNDFEAFSIDFQSGTFVELHPKTKEVFENTRERFEIPECKGVAMNHYSCGLISLESGKSQLSCRNGMSTWEVWGENRTSNSRVLKTLYLMDLLPEEVFCTIQMAPIEIRKLRLQKTDSEATSVLILEEERP